ncbi:MAG: hypothetical protein KDE55_12400 [Novosphingobium sp.]|nr:hypothetical protein [Novosphingobium sp.]
MRDLLHRRRPGALVWLLLAATLFVRAFVPHGWMAANDARSGFVIELCNSDAQLVIAVPARHDGEAGDHTRQAPCAFSGLSAGYAPPPDPPVLPAILPAAESHFAARVVALAFASAIVRPPSRGPPHRA